MSRSFCFNGENSGSRMGPRKRPLIRPPNTKISRAKALVRQSSEAFFGELLQAVLDRFQSLISIESFRRYRDLGSFADVCRHDVYDAYRGTLFSIGHNRDFALEAYGAAHQFAYGSRMKPTLVQNQNPPRLCLSCSLLHRSFV